MECTRWEDEGLLFVSGELARSEKADFESHMIECAVCRAEVDTYTAQKRDLFTVANLSVATTPDLDRRMAEACAKIPRANAVVSLFSVYARKTVLALIMIAAGFGGGMYVAVQMNQPDGSGVASVKDDAPFQRTEQNVGAPTVAAANDSLTSDSLTDPPPRVFTRGGAVGMGGAVPVDVRSK